MRELKCSRMNEDNSDVRYYDGYTKFTVPRVRDNQYNPMIVGEREELFNNVLDSIDKKQVSPRYDDLFTEGGENIDVGGGVEYRGMLNHTDDDYTKVKILCDLLDKKSGKTIRSFEKDLFLDYSNFMDSYGIESDIEDYILDELRKYLISMLAQYDNKYKNENKTMRELKRSRKLEDAGHKSLTGSPLVGKYSKAILDINKFNIQLRDSLFGMVSIINETTLDNQEADYKGKNFDELDALARESIDAIKDCLSDCFGVLAKLKVILHHNQSLR